MQEEMRQRRPGPERWAASKGVGLLRANSELLDTVNVAGMTVNQQIANTAKIAKESKLQKQPSAAVSIQQSAIGNQHSAVSNQYSAFSNQPKQSAKTQNNDLENVIALRPSRDTRLQLNIDTFCHCFAHEYVVV